jgi:predicted nuclease of predicted toxin-antitoxin system
MNTKKILLKEQLKNYYTPEYLELILNDINILKTTLKKMNIKYDVDSENILDIYEIVMTNILKYKENNNFIILDIERDILNLIKEIHKKDKIIIFDCNSTTTIDFIKNKISIDLKPLNINFTNKDVDINNTYYLLNSSNIFIFNKKGNKTKVIKVFENIIILDKETLTLKEELNITNGYKDV